MKKDKFLIGYLDNGSGLQTNLKPWLITDNAFEKLSNMYVLRGRVKKRFGSILMGDDHKTSRLRLLTTSSYGAGVYTGTIPGVKFRIGQMFSVGDDIFTVYQTGTPAAMLASNVATSGTFNTTTGAFSITGEADLQNVYFYPSDPVMGLSQYFQSSTNNFGTFGFDTQFSYIFDPVAGGWDRISNGDSVWTGTDYQLFWQTNYRGIDPSENFLWVSNFKPTDGIRYFDGTNWVKSVLNWTRGAVIDNSGGTGTFAGIVPGASGFIGQVFNIGTTAFQVVVANGALLPFSQIDTGPVGNGTFDTTTGAYSFTTTMPNRSVYFTGNNYIQTAKLIIQFNGALLLLNTVEMINGTSTAFRNRLRYSSFGDPLNPNSWMQDVQANDGSGLDAPTQQSIVTAQFIKDRLIVYFEDSTYEIAYTQNEVYPFKWQKINTELGAISTFSEIPFDKVVLGIDDNGVHACNGANVERIDNKIPQYPFGISNENHGQDRVVGVRDYYNEMAYWTLSTNNRNDSFYFPNQILVYNYINESWATIDDSFTTFGYFFLPPQSIGLTWGETTTPWGLNGNMWNSSASTINNTTIKSVLAGNQEGFVSVLQSDTFNNAPSLQITNFNTSTKTITCINHNLSLNQYVLLTNMNGLTFNDGNNTLPSLIARVSSDPVAANTPNSFVIDTHITITGTYRGGGVAQVVSNIGIKTKEYNFYTNNDSNMRVSCVDFLVDRTEIGQVTVDYLVSSAPFLLVSENFSNLASPGPLPGNSTLETSAYALSSFEKFQKRLWHPVYMWADGECIQLEIYMSPDQMSTYVVNDDGSVLYTALQDFELHAMIFYVRPTADRMQ